MCTPLAPTTDVCDGRDNDCDGAIDEQIADQVCGLGACRRTAPGCAGGSVPACVPGTPTAEVCNRTDDDCDGAVDDGFNLATDRLSCGACGRVCGAGTLLPSA